MKEIKKERNEKRQRDRKKDRKKAERQRERNEKRQRDRNQDREKEKRKSERNKYRMASHKMELLFCPAIQNSNFLSLGVSICLDRVSIETLDRDTIKILTQPNLDSEVSILKISTEKKNNLVSTLFKS